MRGKLLLAMTAFAGAFPAAAQTFEFPVPSDDRWHYPFNFSPGTRAFGSCFSSLGTGVPAFANFNDRDGVVILAWETDGLIPAGQGAAAYDLAAMRVTLTADDGAEWAVDLTPDEWFTYDVNNDGEINADGVARGQPGDADGESDDADAGRALELYGAGFGPFTSETTWVESTPYVGGTDQFAAARDPYPFVFQDGTGVKLHVEDSVKGRWNEAAGVFSFTPTPWAVGHPQGYTPGAQSTPFDVDFDLDLSLSGGAVRQCFQEQLDRGRIIVVVTALTDTEQFGVPGGVPNFFMKEGDPALAATLSLTLGGGIDGDLDGDGCVDLEDLAVLLGNFGTLSGATPEDGDVDGDGDVDLTDLALLLGNFGSGAC